MEDDGLGLLLTTANTGVAFIQPFVFKPIQVNQQILSPLETHTPTPVPPRYLCAQFDKLGP